MMDNMCRNPQNVHQKVWPLDQDSFLVRGSVQRALCACWGGGWVGYFSIFTTSPKTKIYIKISQLSDITAFLFPKLEHPIKSQYGGMFTTVHTQSTWILGLMRSILDIFLSGQLHCKGLEVIQVQAATYVAPTKSQCKAKPPAEDTTSITTTKCH